MKSETNERRNDRPTERNKWQFEIKIQSLSEYIFVFENYCFELNVVIGSENSDPHTQDTMLLLRLCAAAASMGIKTWTEIENVDGGKSIELMLDNRHRRPFLLDIITDINIRIHRKPSKEKKKHIFVVSKT